MKKILSLVCLAALGAAAVSANTITGTVSGFSANDTIFIKSTPVSDVFTHAQRTTAKRDTAVIAGNKFSFKDNATEPMLYEIFSTKTKIGNRVIGLCSADLLMQAGETVNVSISYSDAHMGYTATGSELNKSIAQQLSVTLPVEQQLFNLYATMTKENQETVSQQLDSISGNMRALALETAKNDISNPASAYLLSKYGSGKAITEYAPKFQGNTASPAVTILNTRLKQVEAARKEEKMREKNTGNDNEGKAAIDFTLTDLNGKPFKLSSLHGKFVILDFWGSWCGWCIKGMPALKDFYNKHKSQLEVVSVACNDTKAAWKAAVAKHGMNWVNVFNPSDVPAEKNITIKYAIQGYPTKYLIDPEGKIVVKVVGEDPDFYAKVEAAMNKAAK